MALDFFVDRMFIQWESLRKELHYFSSTVISKCRKWHLRGTYHKFFLGQHAPRPQLEAHACGDHGHSYAGPKTAFFQLTGLESLKLAFLKFNWKFNSAALWIIQLQTHQEYLQLPLRDGAFSAISCPTMWGICRFLRTIKTNPHLYPGLGRGGGVGVYFDWCIINWKNCK